MHSTARTVVLLESPQDREATIKTLLMVLGCSCDPDNFQDPADLRAEPVPEEIEEEYLIYALFERDDRPDGAFLSKRWCSLEDILDHTPPGLMLTKIKEWNQGRAARESAAVSALFLRQRQS
uniref:Uncharacterized protein n=1 Tax=Haptolina ericina TaxID=156174 RepID=A0A7S3ES23_9EUKA|mmetsp:Transcript_14427/g.32419  ORF Transcript_14427/g.32419 Transcript_14427/m.32419 type:complete len:122 (+) Transcript_14427:189-554(+)